MSARRDKPSLWATLTELGASAAKVRGRWREIVASGEGAFVHSVDVDAVDRLEQLALELGERGREDAEAVKELQRAAGRRRQRRRLETAGNVVRVSTWVSEDRVADRACRLLVAAATDEPIAAVSPENDAWFARIEELEAMGPVAGFEYLTEREPRLRNLVIPMPASVAERERAWDELCDRLEALVGNDANTDDLLLRSAAAYGIARIRLAQLTGFPLEDP